MITVYRYADRRQGRALMVKLINLISSGVPKLLTEIITLGRTLKNQSVDVLNSLDRPRHIQRTDRDDQRLPRAPTRLSTPIPKPHPLHRRSKLTNSDLNCTLNCEELGKRLSQLDGMVR